LLGFPDQVGNDDGCGGPKRWLTIQSVVEIIPIGIIPLDQVDLPAPVPFLEPLLAMNSVLNVLEPFGVDEAVNAVSFSELRADAFTVLEDAARQVGGDADVKRAVRRAGEDVDPAGYFGTLAWGKGVTNVAWVPRFVLRTPVG
jgi:hypothetical protein